MCKQHKLQPVNFDLTAHNLALLYLGIERDLSYSTAFVLRAKTHPSFSLKPRLLLITY